MKKNQNTILSGAEFKSELNKLLRLEQAIIGIESKEEARLDIELINLLNGSSTSISSIYTWDIGNGLKNLNSTLKQSLNTPLDVIQSIENMTIDTRLIFILREFHTFLNDIQVHRRLLNLLKRETKITFIFTGSEIEIPPDLTEYSHILEFPLPDITNIKHYLYLQFKDKQYEINESQLVLLTKACQGLSQKKIQKGLKTIFLKDKPTQSEMVQVFLNEKKEMLRKTGILDYHSSDKTLDSIVGYENLKKWLDDRFLTFTSELDDIPIPKGLILAGVQGTGKSAIIQGIGNKWDVPTVSMDMGKIFGGYVGESERRMREAIQIVEAMQPCILWIDELDKSLANGTSNDSGTTSRVYSTLLTWLSEKKSRVFVAATANDLRKLPPELIRKGRFDETFHILLPKSHERKAIFQYYIKTTLRYTRKRINVSILVRDSEGYSGAEIEQVMNNVLAQSLKQKVDQKKIVIRNNMVVQELKQVIPLSKAYDYDLQDVNTLRGRPVH